jgi:superfamily II DNA or RNA helicase
MLSADDITALRLANNQESRAALLQLHADRFLDSLFVFEHDSKQLPHHVALFAWLLVTGALELRFAFPKHIEGAQIFHEKYGIFAFPMQDSIAFIGSANETVSGHHMNYESIDVYRSWIHGEDARIAQKVDQFAQAWDNNEPGLAVLRPGQDVIDRIKLLAPAQRPNATSLPPTTEPIVVDKWRHQVEAIDAFITARSGVLEMATGTGKTRVAIDATTKLLERAHINSVIVATDGNDLLDQWHQELAGRMATIPMPVYRHFGAHHELGRYGAHPSDSALLISRDALPQIIRQLSPAQKNRTIVIHDEVHGLGSAGNVASLSGTHGDFAYRLGLSATPEREYDEAGTEFIIREIGPVLFQFDLTAAIQRGVLCEFDYRPISYQLTTADRERLRNVYSARAARQHAGNPMSDPELFRMLADVYKTAEEKPGIFANLVRQEPTLLQNTIIFAHTKEYATSVAEIVHSITPRFSTYFDDDHKDQLRAFARGDLDCLITCHRISQGIDIRHLKNVILLSADRARLETIQRIGRCLRIDPDYPLKRATVVDFVRQPDDRATFDADRDRCEWLSTVASTRKDS